MTAPSSVPRADPAPPRLVVRTVTLDPSPLTAGSDAGTLAADRRRGLALVADRLERTVRERQRSVPHDAVPDVAAWWREGAGLLARGSSARLDTGGDRGARPGAAQRWDALVERARVSDDVQAPGTGLVGLGSLAFDPASPHGSTLVVPRVLVGHRAGVAWVTTAVPAHEDDAGVLDPGTVAAAVDEAARALREGDRTVPAGPGAVHEDPPASDWRDVVRQAIRAIEVGEAQKVVAARALDVRAERPVDAAWLVDRLAEAYPGCWTFSVDGLVGATPELLVRLTGRDVVSRVLAGTAPTALPAVAGAGTAGTAPTTGDDLSASAKDQAEHAFAVASVTGALRTVCDDVTTSSRPFPLVLPNVVHLATDVHGTLRPGWPAPHRSSAALRVASVMHPTAAVCGTPSAAAAAVIRRIEGMDRGRYAGPVGWLDARGDGEWGIALRSAELDARDPRRLRLFAGCGIVAGSDPEVELAESEAKLVPLRDALGIG